MNWLINMLKSFGRGAREISPSCREATRLQSQVLDCSLSLRQRIGLRIHLWLCRWCNRYGKQIRFLRSAAQHQDEHEQCLPTQSLSSEVRERMKQQLKIENHQGPEN